MRAFISIPVPLLLLHDEYQVGKGGPAGQTLLGTPLSHSPGTPLLPGCSPVRLDMALATSLVPCRPCMSMWE